MVTPKKKPKRVAKKKRGWLPASRKARTIIIALFVAIVAIAGIVALRNSFAYTPSFTYYSQKDPAWANKPYPYVPGTRDQSDIALSRSGCGPASMAMVATALSRRNNPYEIGQWYGKRYHYSSGTSRDVYPVFAKDYGLKYSSLGNFSNRATRVSLQQKLRTRNTLAIVHAGPGTFTRSGHIMVIRAYNPGNDSYLIADPNNSNNNRWFKGPDLLKSGNLNSVYTFAR
jgi:hypothetical protein